MTSDVSDNTALEEFADRVVDLEVVLTMPSILAGINGMQNRSLTWFAIIGAPKGTPAWPQGPLSTLLPPEITWVAFRDEASSMISCMIEVAAGDPVNSRPWQKKNCEF